MSYWPELLIETYHLMKRLVRNCRACQHSASTCQVCDDMTNHADKIKKRMKSLGYYDCWEDDNGMEVEVP